ncbi:BMP family ABC transporter substrate-binding protein [Lachnospiraceae bacterium ZAX-1]
MKKKLLGILLTAILVASTLTGCGSSSSTEGNGNADSSDATDASNAEAPTDDIADTDVAENAALENGTSLATMKIGEIQSYYVDDGGWCQAMHTGILQSMNDLGIPEENLYKVECVDEDLASVESAFESLVDEGVTVVVGCSSGYASFLSDLAPDYPEITIIQQGDQIANLVGIQIRGYEGMFLAGYASALMSETGELGFAASMNEASVRTAINAYALGAKYAKENATVQVVWADSWYDIDIETQNALSLINSGITYMGMEASSPAIPQTCEENGAYVVGYNVDMKESAPKAVLFSFMWNWTPIFTDIFKSIENGTVSPDDYYYLGGECSALSDFNADLVPDDVQSAVTDAREKINSGDIVIYGGELKDDKGNILVEEDAVMADEDINLQDFFVENVKGAQ